MEVHRVRTASLGEALRELCRPGLAPPHSRRWGGLREAQAGDEAQAAKKPGLQPATSARGAGEKENKSESRVVLSPCLSLSIVDMKIPICFLYASRQLSKLVLFHMLARLKWEFPKIRGSNIDPK